MLCLSTADVGHFGRVSCETLPQQALMELLVTSMAKLQRFQDADGVLMDIEKWPLVECNASAEVESITWEGFALGGKVDLQWLPASVTACNLRWNTLGGSLDLTRLPNCMRLLYLSNNNFEGTVDLTRLPGSLERLDVAYNQLSGTIDLRALPPGLKRLSLGFNLFTGTVDISRLPAGMQDLIIAHNNLSGDLDLRKWRGSGKFLHWDNKFSVIEKDSE